MTTMMVMMMLSSLLIGFAVMITSDNELSSMDISTTQSFYQAQAGLEQLTSDLGALFIADTEPTGDQVRALAVTPPTLDGVTFVAPDGGDGYTITFPTTTGNPATGDPVTEVRTVSTGPFQGLIGLVTPYDLEVTAHRTDGAETTLRRSVQTASVPLWEFGVYAETDLIFFPGPLFTISGMIHTNADLYAMTGGGPMIFEDRVSAVGDVIRRELPNGYPTSTWSGDIRVTTTPGNYRDLGMDEGSVVGNAASNPNEPVWTNLSTGTYNSRIINGRTGARPLSLPLTTLGAEPIDLIRRAPATELVTSQLFAERHFSQASLRILLSDTAAALTALPGIDATPPLPLGNLAVTPIAGYNVTAANPPFAISKDGINAGDGYDEGYRMPLDTPLIGGFLKIEMQTSLTVWQDVTLEILNLGIAGRSIDGGCAGTTPNPNAVIRIQRVRDDAEVQQNQPCGVNSTDPYDYWPNVLYDTREGIYRDIWDSHFHSEYLGGVMHFIELDVNNLRRWFDGTIGASGTAAMNPDGYLVYFSDRRGNRDALGQETGEFGMEDFVNAGATGWPNGLHDLGEDVNGNGTLQNYGQTPVFPAGVAAGAAPLDGTALPLTHVGRSSAGAADYTYLSRANPPLFFRRALKLVNGALGNLPATGLTVSSENPVYLQGDYNAGAGQAFGDPHVPAAIIADAVTVLSNNWTDWNSHDHPHRPSSRSATDTWYRVAIGTGTSLNFPRPSGAAEFGTDGGIPNFLRFLESWSGSAINYRGSLGVLFTSRQGVGTFKCCNNVYSGPTRNFSHDNDFFDLNLLPPATPFLTDVNITGFQLVISPTQ